MKVFLLFLALSLTTAFVTQAQSPVQFGIKGGYNLASLKNEQGTFLPDSYTRSAYHGGVLLHMQVTPNFALQPEVVYSSQGARTKTNKYIANYVNVPVLAQWLVGNGFRLQTGPQVGFLTGAQTEDFSDNENGGLKLFLKDHDFSWSVGAGYLSPVGLGLDVRYNHGISNIRTSESDIVKNRVIQAGIFYQF